MKTFSRYMLAAGAALLLAGCGSTPSTHVAIERMNSEFAGRDINQFFLTYGSPSGSRTMHDGGRAYRWISLDPQGGQGGYLISPGGHYTLPQDTSNGEMITGYCEVSLRTDSGDRIRKITLVNDSIGKQSGSRCAEIFGLAP